MPTYDFETGVIPTAFETGTQYPFAIATDQANGGTYSLKSGCAGVNRAFSQLTLRKNFEAGDVSFHRRYDTESGFDKFVFLIDGVVQTGYPKSGSGTTWTQDTFTSSLTAGVHSLDWIYQKDSSSDSGGDAVWLDDIVVPNFTDLTHTVEGFEGAALPSGWTNDATQVWTFPSTTGRRKAGTYIAKSASNFLSATSDLSFTVTTAAGVMGFYYRVESEAGFDFFKFYIDGAIQSDATSSGHYDIALTGELAGFRCRLYTVTAASHTFKWEYSEDSGTGGGDTCVYLDQVFYPEPSAGPVTYTHTGSGGFTFGGAALRNKGKSMLPAGGLTLAGAAPILKTKTVTPAGGFQWGGSAIVAKQKAHLPQGGFLWAGTAPHSYEAISAYVPLDDGATPPAYFAVYPGASVSSHEDYIVFGSGAVTYTHTGTGGFTWHGSAPHSK